MVNIRNTNDIILNLIDFYRLVKPELDTKPGTVTRDIFISPLATQLSLLFDEINNISSKQSLRLVIGSDLDKLGKNFGISRQSSTYSSGICIFTFASVEGNFVINKGDLVYSQNGVSFQVNTGLVINSSNSNYYKGIATKYKTDLENLGITDQYAVELSVTASTPGISGNISKYSLARTNALNVNNVLNVNSFNGGLEQENDATFRNRILSTFSGSSIGTNLGYYNTALSVSGVLDAYIVEPNDPLMVRDGTIVSKNTDGSLTITKEGNGGKVDIVILGSNLVEANDSFIYLDKSNTGNANNSANDYILGQIIGDENKTVPKKRVDNIKSGILPTQPVDSIVQITGSLSGNNFKEKSIDEFGRISGNYELVKDTGYYSGSPWGFDKLVWSSNEIEGFQEDRIKNQTSGQDNTTYSDVTKITKIEQNILISNENSRVSSDRSIIQLLHYPCLNVTRVFNTNTGERYLVTNQNVDGSGSINTTGRIKISGNTLPTTSDILQVDYSWVVSYDNNIDFDGLYNTNNYRVVDDSIDWGYSSLVRDEIIKFVLDDTSSYYIGTSTLPINNVLKTLSFNKVLGYVYIVDSGKYVDRLAVAINNFSVTTDNVYSIKSRYIDKELYNTSNNDGLFSITTGIFESSISYDTVIILPTDTVALEGELVEIYFNTENVFNVDNISGTSSNFTINIPTTNIDSLSELYLMVSYIANANQSLNANITSLPSSKLSNGFLNKNNIGQVTNINNNIRSQNATIKQNTEGDLYIELDVYTSSTLVDVVCVFNITNNTEYWNVDNIGTIDSSGEFYNLILDGYNTPSIGDNVIAIYYTKEISRFQNLNYSNDLILYNYSKIKYDGTNYYVDINSFTAESGIDFSLITQDGYELYSGSDGYIVSDSVADADFGSLSFNFSSLSSIFNYKIKLYGLNYGEYDILSLDSDANLLNIKKYTESITEDNIFAIRIKDNKILDASLFSTNNKLKLSGSYTINDYVFVGIYKYKLLKNSASKLNLSISDNVINQGSITVQGTTLYKAKDIVFNSIYSNGKVDFSEAIRKYLGLNSNSEISSSIKIVNVVDLYKVTTSGSEVLSKDHTYNLFNIGINKSLFFNNLIKDSNLNNVEISLNESTTVGDKLLSTFYFIIESDSETINFTRNGNQYTNKTFLYLNKVLYSGFKSSQSTKLNINLFNQPNNSSRYKVTYNYTAPKQNERITINYNYNKLIGDVTFANELKRPINADVLIKEANKLSVSIEILILITLSSGLTEATIKQNVNNAIANIVNTLQLGRTLQDVDIQIAAENIAGVDRSRIIYFNKTNTSGSVTELIAQNNEYFELDTLTINTEFR